MRLVILAVGAFVLSSAGAEARCGFSGGVFFFGTDTRLTGECDEKGMTGTLAAGGGAGYSFKSLEIVEKAKHGRTGVRGVSLYAYLPEKGYKGSDRFVLRSCGESRYGNGCANLTYDIVDK
jgi:hypothetical protein